MAKEEPRELGIIDSSIKRAKQRLALATSNEEKAAEKLTAAIERRKRTDRELDLLMKEMQDRVRTIQRG